MTYSEEIKLLNGENAKNDFEVLINGKSLTTPLEIDANKVKEKKAAKVIIKLEDFTIEADDTISIQLLNTTDIKDLKDKTIEATEAIPVEIVE